MQKLLNTLETYLGYLIKQQMPKSQFAVQKFQPDLLAHSDDQNKCKFSVKKTQRGHKTLEIFREKGHDRHTTVKFRFSSYVYY